MKQALQCLAADDTGAVTIDWVVLSAAILGIALLVLTPIATGADSMAQRTSDLITSQQVGQD
jgi:hypothetical protein